MTCVIQTCVSLKSLTLLECAYLTNSSLVAISLIPGLKHLRVGLNENFTTAGLIYFDRLANTLVSLQIHWFRC